MRRLLRVSTPFLVGLIALGATEVRAQGRIPNFPLGVALPDASGRNGLFWLGGDSAQGTYLAPDVSFWAFGDTFLGAPGVSVRDAKSIVSNTVAIGQIVNGNFTPRYFYRGTSAKKQAFFPDPGPSHKYWPKVPVLIKDKLYVFLTLIYFNLKVPLDDPKAVADTGAVIARVNNPFDMPTLWRIDYLVLHLEGPWTAANLKLGIEVLPAPSVNGLIVYGFFNNAKTNSNKSIVLLISNDALRDTPNGLAIDPAQVQYLAADASNANPRWKPGFGVISRGVDDYLDTGIDCISGFTVRWNSILGKWQVVGANSAYAAMYPYPRNHPYKPRPCARIFVHPSPFGPFLSSPEASNCYFHTFSELKSRDDSLFVYAARQWQDPNDPLYNTDASLLMTYTFSSRDISKQLSDPKTYQNHAALVPNPFSGSQPNLACAEVAKLPPTDPKSRVAAADPFGSPGVPRPLPFPAR